MVFTQTLPLLTSREREQVGGTASLTVAARQEHHSPARTINAPIVDNSASSGEKSAKFRGFFGKSGKNATKTR
jgi:hypothetical protein